MKLPRFIRTKKKKNGRIQVEFLDHCFEVEQHQLRAATIISIVICLAGISTFLYRATARSPEEIRESVNEIDPEPTDTPLRQTAQQKKEARQPLVLPRRLDGMIVAREDSNNVPVCVMIENAAFGGVRPQSGLSRAVVIYEVIVEGGITRFMAVFAGEHSERVGPVRSARDTYLEFASELNCAYIHAGGSFTAIQALKDFDLRRSDALIDPSYFWRDAGLYSPHNLFTSTDNLEQLTIDHHWALEDSPDFASWLFVDAMRTHKRPDPASPEGVQYIRIAFGGAYDVEYDYNHSENVFLRSNGGVQQTDAVNGEAISAKNVIVQHVGAGIEIEGKGRINWPVTGEGAVEIFHDGTVYHGTWKKATRLSRTEFVDEKGKPLPLTRGNSWVEIVPEHISVSYE